MLGSLEKVYSDMAAIPRNAQISSQNFRHQAQRHVTAHRDSDDDGTAALTALTFVRLQLSRQAMFSQVLPPIKTCRFTNLDFRDCAGSKAYATRIRSHSPPAVAPTGMPRREGHGKMGKGLGYLRSPSDSHWSTANGKGRDAGRQLLMRTMGGPAIGRGLLSVMGRMGQG